MEFIRDKSIANGFWSEQSTCCCF